MEFLSNIINQSQYELIAPFIFVGILLIGTTIGFINGFRVAIFFLVLNIISIVTAILIFNYREEITDRLIPNSFKIGKFRVKDLLSDGLSKIVSDNPELGDKVDSDFANENRGFVGIYNLISSFIVLIIYIFLNIFIFMPIYFIFRKRLKSKIFENKIVGNKMIKSRIGGAIIGFITFFPIAVIIGALLASLGTTSSNFSSFISELTNVISFGKIKNIPESMKQLKKLIEYLS